MRYSKNKYCLIDFKAIKIQSIYFIDFALVSEPQRNFLLEFNSFEQFELLKPKQKLDSF